MKGQKNIEDHNNAPFLCETCKHFSRGSAASRFHPEEPTECDHPTLYALMSTNMKRGVIRKCKGYENKRP